jgi:hypothetical protein
MVPLMQRRCRWVVDEPPAEPERQAEPERRPNAWDKPDVSPAPVGMVQVESTKKPTDQDKPKTTDNAPNPFDHAEAMKKYMERLSQINDGAWN